ncbi:MAG: beta strand repeat-containing protein [Cytophagaceae bacterium]
MVRKLFILSFFVIILNTQRTFAIVYYSQVSLGGGNNAVVLGNWNSQRDGSGTTPISFSNGDEFWIINGDSLIASSQWNIPLPGKLVIEDGRFNASGFDHNITLDQYPGTTYYVLSSYQNLTFGNINNSSNFHLRYQNSSSTSFLRSLTYQGNLILNIQTNTTTNVTLNQNLTVIGNLIFTSSTTTNRNFNVTSSSVFSIGNNFIIQQGEFTAANSASITPIFNISGNFQISGGAFNGTRDSGTPVFNIGGNLNISGGVFRGVVGSSSGNPTFNISGNLSHTSGTYSARASTLSTGRINLVFEGTGSISTIGMSNSDHRVELKGNYSLQSNFTVGNSFTQTSGNLNINANTLILTSNIVSGSGTLTGGTTSNLSITNSSSTNASLSSITLNNLTILRNATISLTGSVTIHGILTLTNGILNNSTNSLIMANGSSIVRDRGTISSTPVFQGTIDLAYNLSTNNFTGNEIPVSNSVLRNFTLSNTNNTTLTLYHNLTVNGILTVNNGSTLDANSRTITLNGNFTNNGNFSPATSTVIVNGVVSFSGSNVNLSLNNLTITSSGTLIAPSGTLSINNLFTVSSGGTFNHNTGTVSFDRGGGSSQNIPALNYFNLSSTQTGARILASGTIGIAGLFTPGTNSYTTTGSTVNFNGSNNQIIPTSITYNNLTLSTSGNKQFSNTLNVNGQILIQNSATFTLGNGTINLRSHWTNNSTNSVDPGTSTVNLNGNCIISGSISDHNFYNLVVAAGYWLNAPASNLNIFNNFSFSGTPSFNPTTGSVNFVGSAPQLIPSVSYNNLGVSGSGSKTLPTSVTITGNLTIAGAADLIAGNSINLSGNWINNGATFSFGTCTVNLNGNCVISGSSLDHNFYNLNLNSGSSLTAPSGNLNIYNSFNINPTASFLANNGTVNFASSGSQTIPALNYHNLSSSNSGVRVLSSGTSGISGLFNPSGSSFTVTGSTVDFNGTSAQNIPTTINYNHITFSGSGNKSISNDLTVLGNLLISGSAVLVPGNNTINLSGDWSSYNASGLTEAGSTLNMNGTSLQTINTAGGEIFNNLTINNSAGVTLSSVATVNGVLRLLNGALNSSGNLTINMNSGYIHYSNSDNGSISGNITVYKDVNTFNTNHYFACPVAGTTANDFADDFQYFNPSNGYSRLNVYANGAWSRVQDVNTPLNIQQGYSFYPTATGVLDFTGTYSHGALHSTFSYPNAAQTMEFVGNPYPSNIDWDNNSGWSRSNLTDIIYTWNTTSRSWSTYSTSSGGTNGGSNIIPSMQSFFVLTNGNGNQSSLSINNLARTNATSAFNRMTVKKHTGLRIIASSGNSKDETFINLNVQGSAEGFDNYDAYKLKNADDVPSVFTKAGKIDVAINAINYNRNLQIPLGIVGEEGAFTFSFEGMEDFESGQPLFLIDRKENIVIDLSLQNSYSFNLTKQDSIGRFIISARADNTNQTANETIYLSGKNEHVNIIYNGSGTLSGSIIVTDIMGREIIQKDNIVITPGINSVPVSANRGLYIIKAVVGSHSISEKVFLGN